MLVSYEEFGKSGAINRIGQDELYIGAVTVPNTGNPQQDNQQISDWLSRNAITSYYIVNYGSRYQIWFLADAGRPEMKDKLLAKLLPFNTGYGQGLEHFKMVYNDRYNYIWIYKIV
jgi:hydroxylamine oxidation protein HaoB